MEDVVVRPGSRAHDIAASAIVLAGLSASIVFALCSAGAYQLDDLTHYMIARSAWTYPSLLLFEWGRPGFTVPYFLPAGMGWTAARLTTAVVCAATAWLAYRVAGRMGTPVAWVVPVLVYLQPLFFELSFTTLTETMLAFYLVAAVGLAQTGRWSLSAAVLSVAFLTRHEAIALLPIWLIVAWRQRVALWRLWPVAWAPVAQAILSLQDGGGAIWQRFLDARPTTYYGHGGWLSMLCRSLEAWGPGVAVLALCGVPATLRRPAGELVAGSLLAYFAAHTVIWALGLFGSGGFPRFLVAVSPLAAICAGEALSALVARDASARRRMIVAAATVLVVAVIAVERQMRISGVPFYVPYSHHVQWLIRATAAVCIVLTVVVIAAARHARGTNVVAPLFVAALAVAQAVMIQQVVRPMPPLSEQAAAADVLAWIRANGMGDRPLIHAHVCLSYLLDEPLTPAPASLRARADASPAGALILWDSYFAEHSEPGPPLRRVDLDASPAYQARYESGVASASIRVYEKTGAERPPAAGAN